jgi:hypothetical protein
MLLRTVLAAAIYRTVDTVGPAAKVIHYSDLYYTYTRTIHTIHCGAATTQLKFKLDKHQDLTYNIHMFKTFTVLILASQLTACAGFITASGCYRDHRDRSYDPCQGSSLMEQLPNWDSRLTIHDAQRGPAARDIVIIDR